MLGGSSSKSSNGSFWSTVTSSPSKLGTEFTGPNYSYAKWIKTPTELGMGSRPDQLAQNVAGIMDYITIITEGGGPASKNDELPLGDRYFLETGGHCKAGDSTVKRSLYINNVPTGNIKFGGTSLTGGRSSLRGLVPGMMENIGKINPLAMFQAFSEGTPECVRCPTSICPVTSGKPNKPIAKSEYNEIKKMRESFQNIKSLEKFNKESNNTNQKIMNNKIAFSYNIGLSLLAAYITYRLIIKK